MSRSHFHVRRSRRAGIAAAHQASTITRPCHLTSQTPYLIMKDTTSEWKFTFAPSERYVRPAFMHAVDTLHQRHASISISDLSLPSHLQFEVDAPSGSRNWEAYPNMLSRPLCTSGVSTPTSWPPMTLCFRFGGPRMRGGRYCGQCQAHNPGVVCGGSKTSERGLARAVRVCGWDPSEGVEEHLVWSQILSERAVDGGWIARAAPTIVAVTFRAFSW